MKDTKGQVLLIIKLSNYAFLHKPWHVSQTNFSSRSFSMPQDPIKGSLGEGNCYPGVQSSFCILHTKTLNLIDMKNEQWLSTICL